MIIKGVEVEVIKGDITEIAVEAIVNAANNKLVMGGGVAGAIKRKGGAVIEEEAVKSGPVKVGESVITSAGMLPSKYVIHSATMGMDFATDEGKIRNSARSALKLAGDRNIKSLAFPALGCGVGGFDPVFCAKIMSQEIFRVLRENRHPALKRVTFVLRDEKTRDIFKDTVAGYLEYISKKIEEGPFVTVDLIIETGSGVVIIERSNPPFGWALPGGFVDYGESLEDAAAREAKEETSLDVFDLVQFHTYSGPERAPRFHTVSTVFTAGAKGRPRAGSDAGNIKIITPKDLDRINFAFDHREILKEYFSCKKRC